MIYAIFTVVSPKQITWLGIGKAADSKFASSTGYSKVSCCWWLSAADGADKDATVTDSFEVNRIATSSFRK